MTAYKNGYRPATVEIAPSCHLDTPVEEYDFNYVFPVVSLQSDRVELRPFTPSLHAQLLFDQVSKYPEVFEWLGTNPFKTLDECLAWIEQTFRRPTDTVLYAIFTDKPGADTPRTDPSQYEFAGSIGLIESTDVHLEIEPGHIIILPPYQRTHVLTHTAGLLLHHILDLPSQGGLGMRRCQWTTTTFNTKSQNAAKRLGFTPEGVLRCQRVLPLGKKGVREGREEERESAGMCRDNWFASVTFYDWDERVREHVDKLMARRS